MSTRKYSSVELGYVHGRPMITAQLRALEGKPFYFEMLIDSGADRTMISQYHATKLGIDYKMIQSKEIETEMADLSMAKAKETQVQFILDEIEITIPILISEKHLDPLLGRRGVFDAFDILFQQRRNIVTFTKV